MTNPVKVSQGFGPELTATPEWLSVSTRQHSAIFEGPEHATEGLLLLIEPSLRRPAIWTSAPPLLELPTNECGALVLRNVDALDRREQTVLRTWLDTEPQQVISTTTHQLFPLIARGLFDEAL